jgi:hypothetical protein
MSVAGSNLATESYVGTSISNLVASAPGTLDTLNELASALGNDASFSTTVSTALGNRLRVDTASQGLDSTQKSNARTNLGLATVASSGSYTDLTSKPTIPAAQIQSDWTQATNTALDYIKNKPALFSGSYTDLTNQPTIPSAYSLPTASTTVLGGVKIDGSTITLNGSDQLVATAYSLTSSGIQTAFGSQTQNYVYAAPGSGGNGNPTFRALVAADIPSLSYAPTASPTFTGTTTAALFKGTQVTEAFTTVTPAVASNVAAFDCSTGQIFNVIMTNFGANFTANLTNLNLSVGYVTTITLILNQGSSAYIPTAMQVAGGGTVTLVWQGGSTPAGVANRKDVVALNILCTAASTYTVFAQLVSF